MSGDNVTGQTRRAGTAVYGAERSDDTPCALIPLDGPKRRSPSRQGTVSVV